MTLRILVVGAGIAGLAAARGLRVAGFRPDVVEELPAGMTPGAGIFLPGNATRALRLLGLDAPLRPLGDLVFRQLFLDSSGEQLFELDAAALWSGVGESRALARADLQQVLLTGVGGEVRYDTAVRDLEILDDGPAKVEFSDGRIAEYDLVVAADGRKSSIRVKSGLGGAAAPTGQIVYRSVITGGPPVSDWTCLYGNRSSFVLTPMGGRKLYLYADETAGSEQSAPTDPRARLEELFGDFGGPVPAVLKAIEKVQVARTDEVVIERWSRGVLRATPGDVPGALGRYEARRRPRCSQVREHTRERDRARDEAPELRDPMLRDRGHRIFWDQYAELAAPV